MHPDQAMSCQRSFAFAPRFQTLDPRTHYYGKTFFNAKTRAGVLHQMAFCLRQSAPWFRTALWREVLRAKKPFASLRLCVSKVFGVCALTFPAVVTV